MFKPSPETQEAGRAQYAGLVLELLPWQLLVGSAPQIIPTLSFNRVQEGLVPTTLGRLRSGVLERVCNIVCELTHMS